ncbi:MAG: sucrose phosphorylase, partial [Anaerolineae bacterium]|nr:sucrose phosphorylase [Anaerolineae bacterium]
IKQEVTREVVQRLLKLIRFRNEYPAFDGEFTVLESSENEVNLSWQKGPDFCSLKIDLDTMKSVIYYRDSEGNDAQYLV